MINQNNAHKWPLQHLLFMYVVLYMVELELHT